MNPLPVPDRSACHHLPASGAHTPATVPIPNFAPSSIRVGQPPLRHAPNCGARCVVLLFDSPPPLPPLHIQLATPPPSLPGAGWARTSRRASRWSTGCARGRASGAQSASLARYKCKMCRAERCYASSRELPHSTLTLTGESAARDRAGRKGLGKLTAGCWGLRAQAGRGQMSH